MHAGEQERISPRSISTSGRYCQVLCRAAQGLFKVGRQAKGEEWGERLSHEAAAGGGDLGGTEGVEQADGGVAEGGHHLGGVPGAGGECVGAAKRGMLCWPFSASAMIFWQSRWRSARILPRIN